jgi:Uma2 family endonuclease
VRSAGFLAFQRGTIFANDDGKMRRVEDVTARVSYADLQRMPDDGNRYELYDGELRVVPAPLPIHQVIAQRLLVTLIDFSRQSGGAVFIAPLDIVLSEYNVVQPDLIYFGPESARRIRLREHVRFAPDLAIEVLSPFTEKIDRGRKRDLLAQYRVPEYWIVDPDAPRIEVSVLSGSVYSAPRFVTSGRCESPTIIGLAVDLTLLFDGLSE